MSSVSSSLKVLPELNIQMLQLDRFPSGETIEARIMQIVNKFNSSSQMDFKHFPIQPGKWNPDQNHQFNLLYFFHRSELESDPLAEFIADITGERQEVFKKTATTAHIFFLHRIIPSPTHDFDEKLSAEHEELEVYALTNGRGYEVVKHITDSIFPKRIAKRLVDPEGRQFRGERISGNIRASNRHNRKKALPFEGVVELIRDIHSTFKKNCSIFSLSAFKTMKSELGILIKTSKVMIKKGLPIADLTEVLNHFSKIYRGQSTLTTNEAIEEDDVQFEYLDQVAEVTGDLEESLDRELLNRLYRFFKDGQGGIFNLCPPNYKEFIASNEFELRKKGAHSPIQHWESVPYFEEVANEIRVQGDFLDLESLETFIDTFGNVRMKFKRKDNKMGDHPLLDFIESEFFYEGNNYFRLGQKWYAISIQYLTDLHEKFSYLLKEKLIAPGEEGGLEEPWLHQIHWASFSRQELKSIVGGNTLAATRALTMVRNETLSLFLSKKITLKATCLGKKKEKQLVSLSKKFKKQIEKLLQEKRRPLLVKRLKELSIGEEDAEQIVTEWHETTAYTRERLLITEKNQLVALEANGFLTEKLVGRVKNFFNERVTLAQTCCEEAGYNQKYISKPHYFVGDRVIRENIEFFDVMCLTAEKVYLYIVKAGFDHKMREVFSQARNAAKNLYAALHMNGFARGEGNNIVTQFFDAVKGYTGKGPYRKKMKEKLQKFTKEQFCQIFSRAHEKRQIYFVCAVSDKNEKERLLEEESNVKLRWSREELLKERLTESQIKELETGGFLKDGRLTHHFASSPSKLNKEIYNILRPYLPKITSTIAKSDLLAARKEVEDHEFNFRVVQIRRPIGAYGYATRKAENSLESFTSKLDRFEKNLEHQTPQDFDYLFEALNALDIPPNRKEALTMRYLYMFQSWLDQYDKSSKSLTLSSFIKGSRNQFNSSLNSIGQHHRACCPAYTLSFGAYALQLSSLYDNNGRTVITKKIVDDLLNDAVTKFETASQMREENLKSIDDKEVYSLGGGFIGAADVRAYAYDKTLSSELEIRINTKYIRMPGKKNSPEYFKSALKELITQVKEKKRSICISFGDGMYYRVLVILYNPKTAACEYVISDSHGSHVLGVQEAYAHVTKDPVQAATILGELFRSQEVSGFITRLKPSKVSVVDQASADRKNSASLQEASPSQSAAPMQQGKQKPVTGKDKQAPIHDKEKQKRARSPTINSIDKAGDKTKKSKH